MKIKFFLALLIFWTVIQPFAFSADTDALGITSEEAPTAAPASVLAPEPEPVAVSAAATPDTSVEEAKPLAELIASESMTYMVVAGDTLYEIAQKYHTTVALLKKSNGLTSDLIRPGMKLKVQTGVISIQVDKSENVLTLSVDDKPVKHYRVATGTNNGTPIGEFKIINKLENPTWFKAGAVVPPESPENILGTRWLGFDNPGYGIHGTTLPESIGHQATTGCVRMLNNEVEELYALVPVGTQVAVTD